MWGDCDGANRAGRLVGAPRRLSPCPWALQDRTRRGWAQRTLLSPTYPDQTGC